MKALPGCFVPDSGAVDVDFMKPMDREMGDGNDGP